jgi:flagellar assembly factor FliW
MSLNFFKHVQNIYIDKDSLKGAKEAAISSIDLFFNQKPSATNNKSNIKNPGATLFLVDVDYSRKPDISQIVVGNAYKNFARVEYHNIITSATASRKTTFRFESPIIIETNKEKSIVVVFDGNEDFVLWKNKKNDKLINTNVVSVGAFGPLVGDFD